MQNALAETIKPDEFFCDLQKLWLGWFLREHPCLCPTEKGKVVVVLDYLLVTRTYFESLFDSEELPTSPTACGFIGHVVSGNDWSIYDEVCYFAEATEGPSRPALTPAVIIDEDLIHIASKHEKWRFQSPRSFLWREGYKALTALYAGEDEIVLKIPKMVPTY
jgi:hypothetical protein